MIAYRALGDADASTFKSYALELEQVLEHIAEAVIVKDLNAVVMYWNREAASLYGFSAAEAVGRPLRELHAAELSDADYAKLLERVRSGSQASSTAERRKKNGDLVRVVIKTTPLFGSDRQLIGEITVARDVTALHRQEEALRAAQVTLQERLAALSDANGSLAREIAARKKSDLAVRRNNRALLATVQQLEAFHRDGEVLSRMAELLQSCAHRNEAYEIVRETGLQLFPQSSGSLFVYRESRDVLEHVASWGRGTPPDKTLAPDECWALRLGSPHYSPSNGSIRCRHAPEEHRGYACVPFHGQGQIFGLFHIDVGVDPGTRRPARETEQRLQAMTDRVGAALANLRLRDAMREMALRDGLTGLYNRRYLEDALNREIHRAERSGKPLAVVMIDIDNFKQFNDRHGHDAGDFVLSALARAIARHIRPADLACRYGGEEFAIVLPEATMEMACERAEEMRVAIRNTNLTHLGQTLAAPSASFGVAVYPGHGSNAPQLLKAADRALYCAKREGRDRVSGDEASCPEPAAAPQG